MTLTTINLAALGDTINLGTEVTGTLPTGNGGTGSTATTFVNAASNVTGTLPVPNGGTGIASGTTDQFLKFTGSTTLASAADNAGKILQVQYDNKASTSSTSNLASAGNYADALSVNITPSASSSTIAITAMINTGASSVSNGACILRCLRDSTQIAGGTASGNRISTTSGRGNENQGTDSNLMETVVWMDNPNTTSQVTYKIQFAARGGGSGTAYVGQTGTDGNSSEVQRTPCHLRLEEIAG